jgi:D-citramalate synthase
VITWSLNDREFKTKGLDADQTESAIKATEKMLNIVEKNEIKKGQKILVNNSNE